MSLTDIVRTVAKNVRQTVSDPGELKEKAKDLPLNVLQTAVAGVGQALMLSDRVRTRLRNLVTGREPEEDKPAAEHETWATATEEPSAKPARREPVIFAPRPSPAQPDPSPTTPDPSTSATPAAGAPTTPVETAASVTPVEATAPATPAEDITRPYPPRPSPPRPLPPHPRNPPPAPPPPQRNPSPRTRPPRHHSPRTPSPPHPPRTRPPRRPSPSRFPDTPASPWRRSGPGCAARPWSRYATCWRTSRPPRPVPRSCRCSPSASPRWKAANRRSLCRLPA